VNAMGSFSLWHWVVLAVLFSLLFSGRGIISELMGDIREGIQAMTGERGHPAPRGASFDSSFALLVWMASTLALLVCFAAIARLIAR
jgi:hypothetical protein